MKLKRSRIELNIVFSSVYDVIKRTTFSEFYSSLFNTSKRTRRSRAQVIDSYLFSTFCVDHTHRWGHSKTTEELLQSGWFFVFSWVNDQICPLFCNLKTLLSAF